MTSPPDINPTAPKRPWLDRIRSIKTGGWPAPPIATFLGLELISIEEGHAVIEMTSRPEEFNPHGTLHGGIFCDLGDAAMGYAMLTTLAEEETFTTLELKANFFKPIWQSRLRATGRIVRRTRTIGYAEAEITDEKGSLVCKLSSTCLVLRGEAAQGR